MNPYSLDPCPCPPFYVATYTYTATCPAGKVGTISITRQARSAFSYKHALGLARAEAMAEATARLTCTDPTPDPDPEDPDLDPFDFAVLRYKWTEAGGVDLDTRTFVSDPGRNNVVGWARNPADELPGYLPPCGVNPYLGTLAQYYLAHGGDNCEVGVEAVLINFPKLLTEYPSQDEFSISIGGFWYSLKESGDIVLEFETYLGGAMSHVEYDFVNSGGAAVQTIQRDANVPIYDHSDAPGSTVATLIYSRSSKTARIELV